jgi:hypothetical protein
LVPCILIKTAILLEELQIECAQELCNVAKISTAEVQLLVNMTGPVAAKRKKYIPIHFSTWL